MLIKHFSHVRCCNHFILKYSHRPYPLPIQTKSVSEVHKDAEPCGLPNQQVLQRNDDLPWELTGTKRELTNPITEKILVVKPDI